MIGLAFDGVEWLLHHPVWLAIFLILTIGALGIWWARPITWRDGEGPVSSGDGNESVGAWALGRLLRGFLFWS